MNVPRKFIDVKIHASCELKNVPANDPPRLKNGIKNSHLFR